MPSACQADSPDQQTHLTLTTRGGRPYSSPSEEATKGSEKGFRDLSAARRGGLGSPLLSSCLEHPRGQRSLAGHSPRGRKESTGLSD